tara:strand:+ start:3004 stop:4665 length:1662 start_codon:yes stop_codon:yes gene_type:complete
MNYKKTLLSILFFFLFHNAAYSQLLKNFTSSFESNSSYYTDDSKTGDFNFDNRFRSNNYINLKSYLNKNWNFELQIESYQPSPLLNYSTNLKKTNISTFNVRYDNNNLNIQLGNFYEQFGSGMILRSWEDKDLGINNSIRGLNLKYRINNTINFTTLLGNQKKGFKYSKGYIIGFNSEFDFSEIIKNDSTFLFGLSYVGRSDNKNKSNLYDEITNLFSARLDYSSSSFYSSFELINKSKNPIILFGSISDTFIKKGTALLFNSGFFKNGLGIDFTFRRLENMSLYSERRAFGNPYNESIVNYLPSLTKQHDYSLTNLYVYAAQPNVSFQSKQLTKVGEIGMQTDIYYKIEKETLLGGKYGTNLAINASVWNNLDGNFDFNNQSYQTNLFGFGEKYFSELSLEIRKKWSSKFENIFLYANQFYSKRLIEETQGIVKSNILVVENTYKINDKKSIKVDLQHLSTDDDTKNWSALGLELNLSSAVSIYVTDMYNYQNPEIEKRIHYYNFGGSYRKGASRYSINYGRQRGGLVCTGGICRYVPESTGISFSAITSFF